MYSDGVQDYPPIQAPARPTSRAFILSSLKLQSTGALLLQRLPGTSLLGSPPTPHPPISLWSLLPEAGLQHVPTSLASLTFIVFLGGDAEEAQDVYCGICSAWWRAPVHCGRVRRWWTGHGGCQLCARRSCTAHSAASHLQSKFLPCSHMSEAGARGVGLQCMGTARATFYYTISLWATHRSEWTCSSISSACPCRWKLSLEMTYAFTDLLQTGFMKIFMNFSM